MMPELPKGAVKSTKNWREERMMKDVPAPVWDPLDKSKLWVGEMPNLARVGGGVMLFGFFKFFSFPINLGYL